MLCNVEVKSFSVVLICRFIFSGCVYARLMYVVGDVDVVIDGDCELVFLTYDMTLRV